MRLKDVALRNAKAKAKPYKLADGGGLILLIHPNGSKYWQQRYRMNEKEKTLSLGVYPEVSLLEAREARDAARKLLRIGKDPSIEKKRERRRASVETGNGFKVVAAEWHKKQKMIWTEKHAGKVMKALERDIFPELGDTPIAQLLPMDVLVPLRKIEGRGAIETAHRTKQIVGQIFRYAVASGKAARDVTADLRGALQPVKSEHYARLSANELPDFLEALDKYDGDWQTRNAVKLLLLTFVRTIELRGALWTEFDFNNAEWRIPASRMKMRREHIVPLSRQALAILESQKLISGNLEHVFPHRNRPTAYISENTILFAIYRMGFHTRTTAHGFRGTASTILHEAGFNSEFIERQLAHGGV